MFSIIEIVSSSFVAKKSDFFENMCVGLGQVLFFVFGAFAAYEDDVIRGWVYYVRIQR